MFSKKQLINCRFISYKVMSCALIGALATFILACGGSGSSSTIAVEPPVTIQDTLDSAIAQGVDGILVFVDSPELIQSYSAGFHDKATQQQAIPSAQFKIASISKLFIAVSAAKLITRQELQLTDTLASWLPEYIDRIENAQTITIGQLLQHRSGIPDFDSQTGFSWNSSHTDLDQTLEYALDLNADFAPNSQFEYSNSNYLLLGKILDKVLGYSHHEFVRTEIIEPLGLSQTFLLSTDLGVDNLMKGYWNSTERSQQAYDIPGGSMVSTSENVAKFIRALNTGGLLSPEEKANYVYFYQHSGWLPGYQSIANYYPDIDTVVVELVSTTGGNSENISAQAYQQILRILRL